MTTKKHYTYKFTIRESQLLSLLVLLLLIFVSFITSGWKVGIWFRWLSFSKKLHKADLTCWQTERGSEGSTRGEGRVVSTDRHSEISLWENRLLQHKLLKLIHGFKLQHKVFAIALTAFFCPTTNRNYAFFYGKSKFGLHERFLFLMQISSMSCVLRT